MLQVPYVRCKLKWPPSLWKSQRLAKVAGAVAGAVAEVLEKEKGEVPKRKRVTRKNPKSNPKRNWKLQKNGTEGPDFFEGKVETDGRSVVVPPPQPDMPSPQQRDILLGSDLHGAGVKDDDDTPTPPVGQPSVAARVLGCPRCYYSKKGCSICRRPGYTPRGPNVRTTGPKAKADPKQKVKKPQAKTKAAAKSKFPKTPGRGKARGRARAQWAKVLLYDLF